MQVDFTTLAQGSYSGYQTADQLVIDSPEQWTAVWQQHTADTIPPPTVPEVDFTRYQIIAVFAGEKRTGGYSVEILAIETRSSPAGYLPSLVIHVRYRQPQPGDLISEVLTYPYHIIRIPRIAVAQVVFERAQLNAIHRDSVCHKTHFTKEKIMSAPIVEQFETFSEAEQESLEFLPEELEAIEAELYPDDLDSISVEEVVEDLEAYFEGDIEEVGLEARPPRRRPANQPRPPGRQPGIHMV